MIDEFNNPSHEVEWHDVFGRKLTEHELDDEGLTDWQESKAIGHFPVTKLGWQIAFYKKAVDWSLFRSLHLSVDN